MGSAPAAPDRAMASAATAPDTAPGRQQPAQLARLPGLPCLVGDEQQ